jgi:hypothetical protein
MQEFCYTNGMFNGFTFSAPFLTSSAQIGITILLLFLLCFLEFSSKTEQPRVTINRRFLYPAIALCTAYFCIVVLHYFFI